MKFIFKDVGELVLPSKKRIQTANYMSTPFECDGRDAKSLAMSPHCTPYIAKKVIAPIIEKEPEITIEEDLTNLVAVNYGYVQNDEVSPAEYVNKIVAMYKGKEKDIPNVNSVTHQAKNFKETHKCTFRNGHLDAMLAMRGVALPPKNKADKLTSLSNQLTD